MRRSRAIPRAVTLPARPSTQSTSLLMPPRAGACQPLPCPQSSSPHQALNFSSFDNWDLETGGEVEEWLCGEINPFLRPVKGERGHFTALLSSINIMRVRRKVSASKNIQKHRNTLLFLQKRQVERSPWLQSELYLQDRQLQIRVQKNLI